MKQLFCLIIFLFSFIVSVFSQEPDLAGSIRIKKKSTKCKERKSYRNINKVDSNLVDHLFFNDSGQITKIICFEFFDGQLDTTSLGVASYDSLFRIINDTTWWFEKPKTTSREEILYPDKNTRLINCYGKSNWQAKEITFHKRAGVKIIKKYINDVYISKVKIKESKRRCIHKFYKKGHILPARAVLYIDANGNVTREKARLFNYKNKRFKLRRTINYTYDNKGRILSEHWHYKHQSKRDHSYYYECIR